jgi:hypothetical protein
MYAEETLKSLVAEIEVEMKCNCDLDNWEPERATGHSVVCRIHREAIMRWARGETVEGLGE